MGSQKALQTSVAFPFQFPHINFRKDEGQQGARLQGDMLALWWISIIHSNTLCLTIQLLINESTA
jgi:hypothetical protein